MSKRTPRTDQIVDCACVIHGTGYEWIYVERLYNMLVKHIPQGIRFHVYTEHDRSVPPHMTKHILTEWEGIAGPKKSWWYKMQLFNPAHLTGNLLYFDLDTVIVRDLSWIPKLSTDYFWGIRDFKYLQRPDYSGLNSSTMWWNVAKFSHIWHDFEKLNIKDITRRHQGDQDYITRVLTVNERRYFESQYFESYRWQSLDGGYDFPRRKFKQPGSGFKISNETAVVVFHGLPKPHQIKNAEIKELWK